MWMSLLLQEAGGGSVIGLLLPVAMIGVMYFLLFLPMQRQRKQQQAMLAALKNGDEVITSGGVVGIIVSINTDDTVILRVRPDNTKLQVVRTAVQTVVQEEKK